LEYWARCSRRKETVERRPTSYEAQLKVFAGAVLCREPFTTDLADAVATMRVIDARYLAVGLPRRNPTPPI
jgi:hypothetical protein